MAGSAQALALFHFFPGLTEIAGSIGATVLFGDRIGCAERKRFAVSPALIVCTWMLPFRGATSIRSLSPSGVTVRSKVLPNACTFLSAIFPQPLGTRGVSANER